MSSPYGREYYDDRDDRDRLRQDRERDRSIRERDRLRDRDEYEDRLRRDLAAELDRDADPSAW